MGIKWNQRIVPIQCMTILKNKVWNKIEKTPEKKQKFGFELEFDSY
jgi:hypothetical protein